MHRSLQSFIFSFFLSTFLIAQTPPNFIFITVDDLNDYTESLGGNSQVSTPNFNALENSGYNFTNAFCNSPGCAPSRTSFMSGKDPAYTQIYTNEDYPSKFRQVFSAANNNEEVFTIPQILKDSGGYYTYYINKIFHNESSGDYQAGGGSPCAKTLSWNRQTVFDDDAFIASLIPLYSDYSTFGGAKIPDSLEHFLEDYIAADSAISFLQQVSAGTANTCGNPFFLAVGFHQPHTGRFVPEKYFTQYMDDIYEFPLNLPYNNPVNAFPSNGIIMPPQPATKWGDYYALPEGGIARSFADNTSTEDDLVAYISGLTPVPSVNVGLTEIEKYEILLEAQRANYVSCYIASVQYIDAQIGRIMEELNSNPTLAENTIIVVVSDHGYSLGEKMHYTKWALWETDIRVPFIIVDPSRTGNKVSSRAISLLDLFPTILDLADVSYPTFSDGSEYLDGESLIPLLNNPNTQWEKPVLTSYRKTCPTDDCGIDFSVRNERFHYIKYHHDNPDEFIYDSLGNVIIEQELYDIGSNRDKDKNEWNNLAYHSEYEPIIDYLDNFFPDSSMYKQKVFKVSISNTATPCFLGNTGKLKLKNKLYYSDGTLVTGAALTGFQFKWSNSITSAITSSPNYNFTLASIPAATFATQDHILFYLHVYDLATGNLVAFDTKTFYLNNINAPAVSYNTAIDGLQVDIIDYTISGSYNSTKWDYSDGTLLEDFIPSTHTYNLAGTYTVKNIVYFGNGCNTSFNKTISVSEPLLKETDRILPNEMAAFTFLLYPNPTSNSVRIELNDPIENASLIFYNISGEVVKEIDFEILDFQTEINLSDLIDGKYFLQIFGKNRSFVVQSFEILRN